MYPIRVCPFFLSCLLSPKFLNMYIFAEESRERKRRKSVFFFFIKKNYFVCVFLVHLSLFFFPFWGCIVTFSFPCPSGWTFATPMREPTILFSYYLFFLSFSMHLFRPMCVCVCLCVWPLLIYTYNEVQQQITIYYTKQLLLLRLLTATNYIAAVQMRRTFLFFFSSSFLCISYSFLATFHRNTQDGGRVCVGESLNFAVCIFKNKHKINIYTIYYNNKIMISFLYGPDARDVAFFSLVSSFVVSVCVCCGFI